MNILLLGASGYLGGNIARDLSKNGHKVICVVRRTSDLLRLNDLNCQLISNEPGQIELTFKQNRIDWVINGVTTYKSNDTLYGDMFESNIVFPLSVLNLAIKYGTNNYMTMGTGLPEEFNVYSFTKAKFSDFGKYLSDKDKINFADLRLEMFYGGLNEPDGKFIRSSMLKLIKGEPLDLTEGTQRRDLIRVEDVLSLIDLLIKTDYVKGYKVMPVGVGESHSIREIIRFIAKCCDSKSDIRFGTIESRVGEPDTIADITWYKDIDFEAKYSYFDGLNDECKKTQNFVRSRTIHRNMEAGLI